MLAELINFHIQEVLHMLSVTSIKLSPELKCVPLKAATK